MLHHRRFALATACLLALTTRATAQPQAPYRDARLPADARVRDLLGRMTLEEKFWQLYMSPGDLADSALLLHGVMGLQIRLPGAARAHAARINALQRFALTRTRLGIPLIPFEEALHGVAGEGATVFPQAIGLAATWDTALMGRVASAIAAETRSRGIRQALSPVVNIASDVRWGRTEETYGEDPLLTSAMTHAFVAAFERAGVVATPKHFVANVGDGGRDSYPIGLSARTLETYHYPPFRAALAAGARSVMTAYNSIDGDPATQSPLLNSVLRRAWGFRGFVISDAAATGGATVLHMTEPDTPTAARDAWLAGLDVVFQSTVPQHRPYLDAVRRGLVPIGVIDSAVARVLRVKFDLGLFENPFVDEEGAARANRHIDHLNLAHEAALASLVLLHNPRGLLPLSPAARRIAVIGADAAEARLGGYSGTAPHAVSILAGIRAAQPARDVRYAPGPGRFVRDYMPVPAAQLRLSGAYFDNPDLAGEPSLVRADSQVDFRWTLSGPARGLARDWYGVRWTGTVVVPPGAPRRIGVEGNDGWRLWIDGRLVMDRWRKTSYRVAMAEPALTPGRHEIRLEYHETVGNARVRLVWDDPARDAWRAEVDSAVRIARASDVAVVVAGIEEGEFRDRAFLALPGRQQELIEAVAATGTPVIVVLVGGSAITMPWLERVGAVLLAWYPGEQGGAAVADVLFGEAGPAGRLPITFPAAEGQLPLVYNHVPTGRGDDYLDLSGRPLFPFGFGLSYTEFAYERIAVTPDTIGPSGTATVRVTVRNTGARAGDEIVQLYLRDVLTSVARPVIQLAGFARVHIEAGASRDVTFTLGPEQLRLLDRDLRWVVEPGDFRVLVGASSEDIRLRGTLTVR